MRVYVPVPSLAPHGGVRVIIDIANWLAEHGHHVRLHPLAQPTPQQARYWKFSPRLGIGPMGEMPDRVLVTSPHSIHLARPHRTVVHLQMLEHLFQPNSAEWQARCRRTYAFTGRLLSISEWNIRYMDRQPERGQVTTYMGNGVDLNSFPLHENPIKDTQPTILVEGWNAYNPTKDVARLAPKACRMLRERGYRVIAYGGQPMEDYVADADEYYFHPSLEHLNDLYERAWVMLKSSLCDARACGPVEAMTKGTPTVRVIGEGDDDLTPENSVRLPYSFTTPEQVALEVTRILEDEKLRSGLMAAGYRHLRNNCSWDRWGRLIEAALKEPYSTEPLPGELQLPMEAEF